MSEKNKIEEFLGIDRDEYGFLQIDKKQIETIHEKFFIEEGLENFKSDLSLLDENEFRQFLNASLFLKESMEIKPHFCEVIKYLMCFIAIESLMAKPHHREFKEWMKTNKEVPGKAQKERITEDISKRNFGEKIEELFEEYKKHYGVYEKVKLFFKKHVGVESKASIIEGVRKEKRFEDILEKEREFCEIKGENLQVTLRKENSYKVLNEQEIEEVLNKKIGLLYDVYRNKVVHEGSREHAIDGFLINEVEKAGLEGVAVPLGKLNYVRIEGLGADKFSKIVEEGLKDCYNKEIRRK